MPAINCPNCGRRAQRITSSHQHRGGQIVKRRRECLYCWERFTTTEHVATKKTPRIKDPRRGE